ncbi:MAG TPA: suppressor of fused domain protein [Chloroflexus aurantiacus]|jgi:hypothetical protein|uniref:Suppressor of fused-like domain-containing protein n=1 Tax=Chloroflexus aurantiacus (strain ATCC 29366 / DSM 635 / J-10-fl) TaxID=324602 RepID=A9WIB3_CHLAA|nr:suppressor of fused domain protein [Chloroflexus aurantiacus]ABY36405.1 hypothetical protein Caur_3214 [Chloroflexus aurantiacus J-10-fl]HBW67869.1 suppressor of fused domain protein [Chloroflexus aurantiacus]
MNEKSLGLCYFDHFVLHLGANPIDHHVFCPEDEKASCIQILTFDNIFSGCRAFCSLGLSLYEEAIANLAEVILPISGGWESIPFVLANTLFYIIKNRLILRRGTVIGGISNIAPEFAQRFGKQAIYFAQPFGFPEGFGELVCDSRPGRVYLACLISQSEYLYRKEKGTDQFEELLEERGVDVFDIERPSCI